MSTTRLKALQIQSLEPASDRSSPYRSFRGPGVVLTDKDGFAYIEKRAPKSANDNNAPVDCSDVAV